ncbi:hypothetical protein [Leptospira interrogans]|uniref:hypothetical protein n=1 Tax=Leptospira interrogans TaxID=173 RepID=UPI0026A2FCD2
MGNTIRSEGNTALSGINSIEDNYFDYTRGVLIQKSNEYYTSLTPQFTTYQYNDPDGELTTILEPSANGTIQTSITKTGFTETRTTAFQTAKLKQK